MLLAAAVVISCAPWLHGATVCRLGDHGGPWVIIERGDRLDVDQFAVRRLRLHSTPQRRDDGRRRAGAGRFKPPGPADEGLTRLGSVRPSTPQEVSRDTTSPVHSEGSDLRR